MYGYSNGEPATILPKSVRTGHSYPRRSCNLLFRTHIRVHPFFSAFVIISMILSGLSACTQQQSNNPIKIGVTVPLTGEVSSDGQALKRGYNLWADAVNKRGGLLGRQV